MLENKQTNKPGFRKQENDAAGWEFFDKEHRPT